MESKDYCIITDELLKILSKKNNAVILDRYILLPIDRQKEEPNMRGAQIVRQWKIIRLKETRKQGIS